MHAKYEVSTSNGSKVIANVKVDNRQTDKQTNRQDKNNMPPIIRSGGIKKGVFVNYECPRRQQSIKLAIFSIKVTVRVTWSLTLISL